MVQERPRVAHTASHYHYNYILQSQLFAERYYLGRKEDNSIPSPRVLVGGCVR